MLITATELKENIGKYLALAKSEDIIITKNGKQVAKLTGIHNSGTSLTDSLIGVIPAQAVEPTRLREERLARHENIN
ncbi:MAG: type II toxin-antitoxin system prevent-host-death family antitoxin [Firmicutes bacterium]|nr:type II toxin-antitoxin system prevent-host-death family antitoxin [Bacillota bacterium]